MKRLKPTLAMLAAATLMAAMTISPMAVPPANAQFSIHFGWQQPPRQYNDVQRQGFHAGIDAGRRDIDRGLPPDPHRHRRFRHPPVPGGARHDFRRGFRHGYDMAYQHRGDWNRNRHDWNH